MLNLQNIFCCLHFQILVNTQFTAFFAPTDRWQNRAQRLTALQVCLRAVKLQSLRLESALQNFAITGFIFVYF